MQADSSVVEFLPSLAAKTRFSAEQVMHESDLPTISDDARKRLQSWGMSDAHILDLRVMMAPLSYTHCREKVAAIKNAYTSIDDNDVTTIKIPHFFDFMGRGDGQCGDLTTQLIYQLGVSDFFAKHRIPIIMSFCGGRSREFFREGDLRHYWLELNQANGDQVVLGRTVLVDPAFRTICTSEESGYDRTTNIMNPTSFSGSMTAVVRLESITVTEDDDVKGDISGANTIILGLSESRRFAISIYFFRFEGKIIPAFGLTDKNGKGCGHFFQHPKKNEFILQQPDVPLFETEIEEFRRISNQAQSIRFLDQSEAPFDLDASSTRSW